MRAEVERAYSKGKPIFPFRVEDVLPSRSLELFISTKHWIDAWQGSLAQHTGKLAKEIALDPSVNFDLSPELRRRVRTQRYMRLAGLSLAAAAIAALVGYLMRPAPLEIHNEHPANVFFMGGIAYPGKPIEVSYMLTDGWDNDGVVYGTFNSVDAFEVYEVGSGGPPKRILEADPKQRPIPVNRDLRFHDRRPAKEGHFLPDLSNPQVRAKRSCAADDQLWLTQKSVWGFHRR